MGKMSLCTHRASLSRMPGYRNTYSARQAQIRDHDELLHIISKSLLRCPALAQVPNQADSSPEYALARLITKQGALDKILVAHSKDELLGCMAVTSSIDIQPLQQNFDLHTWDQLLQPEVYEAGLAALKHKQGSDTDAQEAATVPSQGAITAILQELTVSEAVPNAFAITMLACNSEEHETAAAATLLAAAFDAFPDKDYCLLTLPPDSPEVPLLATFTRLLPPPGASLVESLYLCHRFALLEDFQVVTANKSHLASVSELLSGTRDWSSTEEAFAAAVQEGAAYVSTCQGQVVGLAACQPLLDLAFLQQNFLVSIIPGLEQQCAEKKQILQLLLFVLNPIFAHRTKQMLLEVLKLAKGKAAVYLLPSGQQAPDVLNTFRFCGVLDPSVRVCAWLVPPRHLLMPDPSKEAQHALFAFVAELPTRRSINTHIVIVGASECGLSVIEGLLFHPTLSFNAVTLLAPGGVSGTGAYAAPLLTRLGLQASVVVLDAELVSIDCEQQSVGLSNQQRVLYGALVITAGLNQVYNNDLAGMAGLAARPLTSLKGAQKLSHEELKGDIVVLGSGMGNAAAMSLLEGKGVDADTVQQLLLPEEEDWCCSQLHQAAHQAGVHLQAHAGAAPPHRAAQLATQQGTGALDTQEASLLVLAGRCNAVPRSMQQAAVQSGLMTDGRLVVDAAFRTNDPHIFAAGTIAKFSRRYGSNLYQSLYNSSEVGQRAAASIATTFSSPFVGDSALPQLRCGRLVTAPLPGGGSFACAIAAGCNPEEEDKEQETIESSTDGTYCKITLDSSNSIQSVVMCCSQQHSPLQPAMLLPLIGLHRSYLHDLLIDADTGVSMYGEGRSRSDLPEQLTQPWTGVLYHDQFPQLRAALVQGLVGEGGLLTGLTSQDAESEAAVMHVQNDVVDFVQQQGTAELPQYAVSATMS